MQNQRAYEQSRGIYRVYVYIYIVYNIYSVCVLETRI